MNNLLIVKGFTIFGIEIAFYGLIIAIGMLIGIIVAVKNAKFRNITADDIYTVALYALPLAIIGARLYYVAFPPEGVVYNNFWEIINIKNGGLAIYGGVIGGAVGVVLFCLIHKKNFLNVADVAVVCLILGQAIGRWGNFTNQEAFGYQVLNPAWQWFPFAVYIEQTGSWHLATFFYESFCNFIIFAILMIAIRKINTKGVITSLYFILYGIVRFFIEPLRMDSLYIEGTLIRVSQLLSGVFVFCGIIALLFFTLYPKWKQKSKGQ